MPYNLEDDEEESLVHVEVAVLSSGQAFGELALLKD
jgi:hypothetical protein